MRFSNLPEVGLLLLSACVATSASALPGQPGPQDRVLRAATRRSDVFKRSMRIQKRYEAALSYVDVENDWRNKDVFASKVRVGSQNPVLNLEEIEHHLEELRCDTDSLKLRFVDKVSARDAMHACKDGLVITSHEGCNVEGERSVYKVHKVGVTDDGYSLTLSVEEAKWKEAFSRFDIDFGHTQDDHFYRRHADFTKTRRRRQEGETTVVSSAAPAEATGGVEIPADTPDDVNTVTFDLTSKRENQLFDIPEFLSGIENVVAIPDLPVEIGCKDCSTTGSLVLTQGAIAIDMNQVDLVPDVLEGGDDGKDLFNVITGGFFELAANGVNAHIELFARPEVSGNFDLSLISLPVAGFVIPGIGKAGVAFSATLQASYEITQPGIEVNYGFDIAIPEGASMKVELTNLAESKFLGFPESQLNPLPVTANVSEVEIVLGLGFTPKVPIGFEFLDQLKASMDVKMDLPRLDLKLSTQGGECVGGAPNGTNPETPAPPSETEVPVTEVPGALAGLGPLALVEANVSVSFDVDLSLALPLLPIAVNSIGTAVNVFETTIALAQSCLDATQGFVSATPVLAIDSTGAPVMSPTQGGHEVISTPAPEAHPTEGVEVTSEVMAHPTEVPEYPEITSEPMAHPTPTEYPETPEETSEAVEHPTEYPETPEITSEPVAHPTEYPETPEETSEPIEHPTEYPETPEETSHPIATPTEYPETPEETSEPIAHPTEYPETPDTTTPYLPEITSEIVEHPTPALPSETIPIEFTPTESEGVCDCSPTSTVTVYVPTSEIVSETPPEVTAPPFLPPPAEETSLPPYSVPRNTTVGFAVPTGNGTGPPLEFTGAAVPGAQIVGFGAGAAWQSVVVAVGAVAGAMLLL